MWLPQLLRFNKSVCKSMLLPLLRLNKSVCKSWRALIQTPFFVDRQTTTTTTTSSSSKFGSFILQTYETSNYTYEDDIKMFRLSSGSHYHDDQIQKKKMVFKLDEDLGFSAFFKDFLLQNSLSIVGSCNGIICLHDPDVMLHERHCRRQHYSNLRDVSLWNPATRQFRILPKSIPIQEHKYKHKFRGGGCDLVGFGFDVKTKDYKVLRITPLWDDDGPLWDDDGLEEEEEGGRCMSQVQVYSLSTDSWRLLEDIVIPNQIYGLNGNCFFVGRKPYSTDGRMMLLSFDFTNEIFITMQLPEYCSIYKLVLSYLGEKWAAFTTPRIHSDSGYWYFDIWVLNEQHGSDSVAVYKESWTKLHSFRIKTKSKQLYSKPRCISNNGEFALISRGGNKLQLFNLVTKEAIKDFTIGDRDCTAAYVYEENLVSIMGGNDLLRWQLPTHGTTYKLNLDAPFIDRCFVFGIGLCLTSDTGGCIGVRSLNRNVRDATEGEALAMLEAIKWAKKLELSPIIIESDSKNVVSFFMEDDDDNNSTCWSSEALSLLSEAKLLLNSSQLDDISFQYCSRSSNYVADIAAKLGREGFWHCKEWTANSPGEIVMSLSKDLGIETSEESEDDENEDMDLDADKQVDEVAQALATANALNKTSANSSAGTDDITDALKELNMDQYDEEDDNGFSIEEADWDRS